MLNIDIGNTTCKISKADKITKKQISNEISATAHNYRFSEAFKTGKWDGKTRFLNGRTNRFPTGLLPKVIEVLELTEVDYTLTDQRKILELPIVDSQIDLLDDKLGNITLYDYQQEAVERAIASGRGVVNIATNGGKTEIACGIIQSILPTLGEGESIAFFVDSKDIASQAQARIQQRLGVPVGLIGSGKWDQEEQVNVIMISTLGRYHKVPKMAKTKVIKDLEVELEKLTKDYISSKSPADKKAIKAIYDKKMEKLLEAEGKQKDKSRDKYDKAQELMKSIVCFIADEVHHAVSSMWYDLFMSLENATYRVGLSGTVDSLNPVNKLRLQGCTGPTLIEVDNEFLIKKGISAKPIIHLLSLPDDYSTHKEYYHDIRRDGIIENEDRNNLISTLAVESARNQKQSLIIVYEVEHGEILLDLIRPHTNSVEFIHGDSPVAHRDECLDRLRKKDIDILIATTILDEGIDVPGINSLFLAAGGKSERQVLQRIGRGLRLKEDGSHLDVYDILDYHNKILQQHCLERISVYRTQGFEIVFH